ncbi:AsmA family protein [Vibrio algarum]|uniref:AsmA family protein n=1 Tax=Vibrio algarum TaxID=3020714 RepID=A0ABT4YSB9_9VIBR|nr:AsmA family protein [Vibrio sp. KJ40-1]MDB1124429.1 AsmA family protein [Vibrio sp. KJ40-1]
MKKILLIIGIPVVVIVLAIAALLLFVNPNQFKPLIVEQTKKQTGMDLIIDGDISWQFFPSLGLSLGKTELKNPAGFKNENLLKIEGIGVDVSVMPMFSKELYIGNVSLDGAEIYLETKKDGSSNLDALTQTNKAEPTESTDSSKTASPNPPTSEPAPSEAQNSWTINLAGVSVTNASLEIQDDSTGSYTKLYDVGLTVSEFAFAQWTTVTFAAKGKNNQQNFATEGQAELKLMQDLATYELRNIVLDSSFSDPSTKISSAKVELNTFAFDTDNSLSVSVKGRSADLDIDLKLTSDLMVDKEISQIRLKNMDLNSTFVGDSLPQSPMKITAKSDFGFDIKQSLISLDLEKLNLNALQFDGNSTVKLSDIPQIRFDLHSPNIDLDEFLGLNKSQPAEDKSTKESEASTASTSNGAKPQKEVEPDLSALNNLDVKGKITIDNFKASNAKMQAVVTSFTVNRGVADLNSFSSKLYQGSINASAQLDARKSPASYWAKKQIKGVKVQPLLKDVAENDMLEGTGNIDVNVKGKSLTPTGIKQNLAGTIKINFADGAVNGINVAQLIRVNYAKIKGQKVDESEEEEKKTDFSAMKATLNLNKGVMTTNDLTISSPLLRIRGEGNANYINETMDLLLDTSIVGSLKGQGGKDINDLKDITIPVRVYNKWAEPKYKIEFDQLWKQLESQKKKELEEKAEKELNRVLGDKVKDGKTKELADKLLKGLFN